jgi:hypothetical protein
MKEICCKGQAVRLSKKVQFACFHYWQIWAKQSHAACFTQLISKKGGFERLFSGFYTGFVFILLNFVR